MSGVLSGDGDIVTSPSVHVPTETPPDVVVVSHVPLAQSSSTLQSLPPLHGRHRLPPQSVSVSPNPGSKCSFVHVSLTHDVGAAVGFDAPAVHTAFSFAFPSMLNWKQIGCVTLILYPLKIAK